MTRARARARAIGVTVKPSTRKGKKLDVFSRATGKKLASIGAVGYEDYTTHRDPERRRRYKARHEATRHKRGTPSYFADQILW